MFVEEPVVPTSSNDILASLSILHSEKGRKHRFPLLLRRERALKWTFGTIPESWGGQRSPPKSEKRTRRVTKSSWKADLPRD